MPVHFESHAQAWKMQCLEAVEKINNGNSLTNSSQPGHRNERKTLIRMNIQEITLCPVKVIRIETYNTKHTQNTKVYFQASNC